jgi:hypothetical protein
VAEFRGFREEVSGRDNELAIRAFAGSDALLSTLTSFVAEFRAFRDEQAARNADQTMLHLGQAERIQAILSAFVDEFRAFRNEDATRSKGLLDSVRGLKPALAYEFDAFRGEQSMNISELRDLINTGLDGSVPPGPSTPFMTHDNGDPAFEKLGPTSARIVKHLKSGRNYAG